MRRFLTCFSFALALLPGVVLAEPPPAPAPKSEVETSDLEVLPADEGPDTKTSQSGDILLSRIGEDLASLSEEVAIEEMNRIARLALDLERPDLFRTIMVAHVDPHWEGLSDARTALNMIAWLPDTADYLSARIVAARLAISAGELPALEAQRLWRDLRARVERVGDPALLHDLATAMIASRDAGLLVETVSRFHPTDRERLHAFAGLLLTDTLQPGDPVATEIFEETRELLAAEVPPPSVLRDLARAYWRTGYKQQALGLVTTEPDTVLRLQAELDLFSIDPAPLPEISAPADSTHPESSDTIPLPDDITLPPGPDQETDG